MKARGIIAIVCMVAVWLLCTVKTTEAEKTYINIPTEANVLKTANNEPTEVLENNIYIDCPLDESTQQGIYDICEQYGVEFELIMAMIERESQFNANAVGDNGNSVGLMQIQERWHYGLMEELGVSDLYNPLDNVRVGTALISQYIEESGSVTYALMKYNGGAAYANRKTAAGEVSEYAAEIIETMKQYKSTL